MPFALDRTVAKIGRMTIQSELTTIIRFHDLMQ